MIILFPIRKEVDYAAYRIGTLSVSTLLACTAERFTNETPERSVSTDSGTPEQQNSRECGQCDVQVQTCVNGVWSEWPPCSNESGVCTPGISQTCGFCGVKVCNDTCEWGIC